MRGTKIPVFAVLLSIGLLSAPSSLEAQEYGVYLELATGIELPFTDATEALESQFQASGFEVLTSYEPQCECGHAATVWVLHSEDYAEQLLDAGARSAFAIPLRVALIEDEWGLHVTATNPQSINRTVVSETGVDGLSAEMVTLLRQTVESAFPGKGEARQFGQLRDRGLIGKTMGIIAGGPFDEKIEEIAEVDIDSAEEVAEIAQRIAEGMADAGGGWKWQIRPEFVLDLSEHGVAVLGVTGDRMEIDAFQIVGTGGDDSRDELACPGIDHASAFPIELVIVAEGNRAKVLMVDAMFRMKMFFEDAGKVKFAMNMQMPGSIEDEIRDKVDEAIY